MKNRVRVVLAFLAVFVLSVLVFAFFQNQTTNISVESVFPEQSLMVMAIDHSGPDQVKKVDKLLGHIVDTGFFDDFFNTEDVDFRKLYSVLNGEWKIAFAMSGFEDASEAIFVGKFSRAGKFQDYMISFLGAGGATLVSEKEGPLVYWTTEGGGDYYFARYKDIFFITASKKAMNEAYNRLITQNGFNENKNYLKNIASISLENSGYVYVDSEGFNGNLNDVYGIWGPNFSSSVEGLGNIYGIFVAEENGLRMKTFSNLAFDEKEMQDAFPKADHLLNLSNQVPAGKGLIMYTEEPSILPYVEGIFGLIDEEVDMNGTIEEFASIDTSQVSSLLASPFSFAISDIGEYYPSVSVYASLNEESIIPAKKLVEAFDKYLDGVISDYDMLVSVSEGGAGAFKKEMDLINGGGVNKIYVDWSVFPREVLDGYGLPLAFDLSEVDLQLYYGITGDNVLVLALYPNLDKAFGENVVGDQSYFVGAIGDLNKTGFRISYFSPGPLVNIIDKYMGIFELLELVSEEDKTKRASLNGLLQSFKYLVSTSSVDEKVLNSESFARVGK